MKRTFPREFYIPQRARKIADRQSDAVCYIYENDKGHVYGMGFGGKRQKPDFHFCFGTGDRGRAEREAHVTRYFEQQQATAAARVERRQTAPHNLIEGAILYTSWGYDQTNCDFYEVTRVVGEKTVEVTPIGAEIKETGWLCGQAKPRPGSFLKDKEPKIVRALIQNGYLRVTIDGHSASLTSPDRSHYWSSYA
jgi:hypothetical protein